MIDVSFYSFLRQCLEIDDNAFEEIMMHAGLAERIQAEKKRMIIQRKLALDLLTSVEGIDNPRALSTDELVSYSKSSYINDAVLGCLVMRYEKWKAMIVKIHRL